MGPKRPRRFEGFCGDAALVALTLINLCRVSELLRVDGDYAHRKTFPWLTVASAALPHSSPGLPRKPSKGRIMSLRRIILPAAVLLSGFAGGCATQGPQPTEEDRKST